MFVPPDGGYGWFVALGTFLALFWTAGMIKSYGVIFDRYVTVVWHKLLTPKTRVHRKIIIPL